MNNSLPLISVVISTFNRKEILAREIESIMQSDYCKESIEIIVVDDAGSDGTSEHILKSFPHIKLLRNESERGPAACRNIGIKNAKGTFIFVLDDDNILDRRCISTLVYAMLDNDSIGIAAPAMYYFKEPNRIWCMGVMRSYITSLTKFLYRDSIQDNITYPNKIHSHDFPNAFMINRKVIERIGLFDEMTFPIHYEEADFGERTRNANYEVVCIPAARIWHDIPVPEDVKDKARLFHCHNEFRAFYSGRNRILFHKMYSQKWQFILFLLFFNWLITGYYLKVILLSNKSVKANIRIAKAYLNGIFNGLFYMNN